MPKSQFLSQTSKMPCRSISLDARACITGAKLAKIEGTTCHGCYALKGRYRMNNVRAAMARRLAFMTGPSFVDQMVTELRTHETSGYFRWFDSGDVQSVQMALDILEVCRQTPDIKHWIPSRESGIWSDALEHVTLPDNVTLRMSATKLDSRPSDHWPNTSTVHKDADPIGHACIAPNQGNKCHTCRACWDRSIENISYSYH